MSSEPPEEPLSRSEYSLLSPASPKPIHIPTPTDIPILNMQTDVDFNQTDAHPDTRNPETRPNMWQDPNEQLPEPAQPPTTDASPYSTGADAPSGEEGATVTTQMPSQPAAGGQDAVEDISANATNLQPTPISNPASNEADVAATTEVASETQPIDAPALLSGPDPSVSDATAPAPPDAFSAQTDEAKPDRLASHPGNGAVDIQGLLSSLAPGPAANSSSTNGMLSAQSEVRNAAPDLPDIPAAPGAPGVEVDSSPLSASNLGVPPSGLPPRPPPQEQPLINPNYAHSQHIRDYHPHASHSAYQPHAQSTGQGSTAESNNRNFVPPVGSPVGNAQPSNGMSAGTAYSPAGATPAAQGMSSYAATPASAVSGFSPNQSTFPYQLQAGTGAATASSVASSHAGRRPEDRPWDAEVQRKYDRFLDEERKYVAEGRWEQFPPGSRLFVGNLSSERVTKRDIFHVFHTYGELAQISIKQAYGFVQFLRAEDCMQALEAEQGTQIRDKKIHLEVSKPQKNRPQPQRRSRSPPDQRNRAGSDRYSGGRGGNNRRDDYRPNRRSPSPRGYRDRYDDRYRRRSPSPPSYGGRGGGRYRSPTPRRDDGDDLPLPRRQPGQIPDVQIIVLDNLDRDFIAWVETAFKARNVRVDVLILSPRLSEQDVVRRQIVEGVLAVVKLARHNQNSGQIGLQIFDRSAGANNVRFEEYDNLPPPTCAELVLREKGKSAAAPGYPPYAAQPPQQQQYGYPPPPQQGFPPPTTGYPPGPHNAYGPPPHQQTPAPPQPPGSVPPHLQSLITNLDPAGLQSLLSAMGTSGTPQSANPYGALQQNPQMAGYLQQQQQQQASQPPPPQQPAGAGQVNMQEILARLGSGGGGGR